jgi:hypothetical protein
MLQESWEKPRIHFSGKAQFSPNVRQRVVPITLVSDYTDYNVSAFGLVIDIKEQHLV